MPQPIVRGETLSQRTNTVLIYLNPDELDWAAAVNPAFYRLVDTRGTLSEADDAVYIPAVVTYGQTSAADGVADDVVELRFGASLPEGTYRLDIGETAEPDNTLAEALSIGTLFNVPGAGPDFRTVAFTGDAQGRNDVDMYRFELPAAATITVRCNRPRSTRRFRPAATIQPCGCSTALVCRWVELPIRAAAQEDVLTYAATAGGVFYVGVSSRGNAAYFPANGTNAANGISTGSYLLEIDVTNAPPTSNDDNSSFDTASDLGRLGVAGLTLSDAISPQTVYDLPPYPGGNDEPGHRQIPADEHIGPVPADYRTTDYGGFLDGFDLADPDDAADLQDGINLGRVLDSNPSIAVMDYNFQDIYGKDLQGNHLHNAITDIQRERTREIFELISRYTGLQFRETPSSGLTVAVGDLRVVNESTPVGPGCPLGKAGRTNTGLLAAVVDANETNWGSSEYGGDWFRTAFQMIGHALGLGAAYDLPSIMGDLVAGTVPGGVGLSGSPLEPVFPGDHDLVHLQRLYRLDSTDIDVYRFQLTEPGTFSAETIAER